MIAFVLLLGVFCLFVGLATFEEDWTKPFAHLVAPLIAALVGGALIGAAIWKWMGGALG